MNYYCLLFIGQLLVPLLPSDRNYLLADESSRTRPGPETVAGSSVCGAYQTYFTEEIKSSTPRSKDGTCLETQTNPLP